MLSETPDTTHLAEAVPSARRQETRARLLDAAFEVFTETGFQAASVELITSRAGFTRGAFYSNFSSKEELFVELFNRAYGQRAADLRTRTTELMPHLAAQQCPISTEEAAAYVADFFFETGDEAKWFALETEFLLLAMREPSESLHFTDFVSKFRAELADLVDEILHVAGRRFSLPSENAMTVLGSVYERSFRISAIGGYDAPEGLSELGDRIAELLFAITEEIPT